MRQIAAPIVVMGVSGCGKSTLGAALADALGGVFLDADDFHPPENVQKMRSGQALDDADRAPWLVRLNAELRERFERGEQAILACSALKARYRETLAKGLPSIDWVFLNGDAALIAERLRARSGHYMPPSLLESQLAALERPEGAIVVPIDLPTVEQLGQVLKALYVDGVEIPADFAEQMDAVALDPEQRAELAARAHRTAEQTLRNLDAASGEENRFAALTSATLAACCLSQFDTAERFANEALALAPAFASNWNYGNAVHDAHTALGLVALHRGDVAGAVRELHAAGAAPGSPQLMSFGPTMQLAKALLQAGERAAVLHYFSQCRAFWKMDRGSLDLWIAKVERGEMPGFTMNLRW